MTRLPEKVRAVLGAWTVLSSLIAVLPAAAVAAPACRQPPPRLLVEHVLRADCETCWQQAAPALPRGAMRLDWIAPAGDDAPMSVAALPEALSRAKPAQGATVQRRSVLPRPLPAMLRVADGPAWNGYVGMQITITRQGAYRPGDAAWLALVERVPAGIEGTAVDRQLVRIVIGPLPLDELATLHRVQHLRSVRLPEGAKPERLASVGWLESADGRVLAATQSPQAGCTGPR